MTILERAAISGDTLTKLLTDLAQAEPLAEAFVVSTCNRVEVYADVDRFHAGVTAICELLARHCGVPARELTPYLYVHYEGRAVRHLLAVTSGLDSMVVVTSRSSARYARPSSWPAARHYRPGPGAPGPGGAAGGQAGPGRDRDRTGRGQLAERGDRARLRQRRRPVPASPALRAGMCWWSAPGR